MATSFTTVYACGSRNGTANEFPRTGFVAPVSKKIEEDRRNKGEEDSGTIKAHKKGARGRKIVQNLAT